MKTPQLTEEVTCIAEIPSTLIETQLTTSGRFLTEGFSLVEYTPTEVISCDDIMFAPSPHADYYSSATESDVGLVRLLDDKIQGQYRYELHPLEYLLKVKEVEEDPTTSKYKLPSPTKQTDELEYYSVKRMGHCDLCGFYNDASMYNETTQNHIPDQQRTTEEDDANTLHVTHDDTIQTYHSECFAAWQATISQIIDTYQTQIFSSVI